MTKPGDRLLEEQLALARAGGGEKYVRGHRERKASAAATLGLKSPRTLYKWAYAGRIPSVKIGRLLRVRRSDLEHLITAGERPAFASPDRFPLTPGLVSR